MMHDTFDKYTNNNIIDFIDREIYINLAVNNYYNILRKHTELKIIFFYGAGGFGKTALLEKIAEEMNTPAPIFVSLEITDKDDQLDILVKFRKKLPKKHFYPLFDYAVQFLWNNLNTAKMDTEFIDFTQKSLWQFLKSSTDIMLAATSPVGIAAASIADAFSEVYNKLRSVYSKHKIKALLDEIDTMQPHELIDILPELLGTDIHRAFLNEQLILIIDSYRQYSRHLIDPSSWLISLIQNVGYGLFIITSREDINWPDNLKKYVISRQLDELPVNEVRSILNKKYEPNPELLDNIIKVTGCIPIYLDLAVKSLDKTDWKNPICTPFYFKSKVDIVKKFLAHLPEDEQEAIKVLAIVQIFNQEIFEHLIKDLNLSVNIIKFEDICERTLVRNIEHDYNFYKTHDVISKNISKLLKPKMVQRVLKSYITIIRNRMIYHCDSSQISMLLKHVISLIIVNKLSISEAETEKILDIFLCVKESLLPFNCDDISCFKNYQPLKYVYYFMKALSEERQDSRIRLNLLESIPEKNAGFGKHIKSYRLMKGYLKALCEGSQWLKQIVDEINPTLSDKDKPEWYYGQTKIFFGDCYISYGKFKTGIAELESYRQLLPELEWKENDSFQVTRHIAHGYRFNMLLEEAEAQYRSVIESDNMNPALLRKVYILTNLCETCCYFKPDKVLSIVPEAFSLAVKFNDLKSKGKIRYSLAIACLHKRDFELAQQYIKDSIRFNQEDGYRAGQLYAYMAQAYYEYSLCGSVCSETINIIEDIQKEIGVYGFFSVPIAMMQGNYSTLKQIRTEYEWIDFDKTIVAYSQFLNTIRFSKS